MFHQNAPNKRESEDDPEGYGSPQKRTSSPAEGFESDGAPGAAENPAEGFESDGAPGAGESAPYDYYPAPSVDSPEPSAGHNEEMPNNVLLFTVHDPHFPITVDVLHKVCTQIGAVVNRIVIFRKNGVQAMVECDTVQSAVRAKSGLNGQSIYNGCCTLKVDWGKPTRLNVVKNDQDNWDYTVPSLVKDPAKGQPLLPDPKIAIVGGAPYGFAGVPPRHGPQVVMYGADTFGPPPPLQRMPYCGPPPASAMHGQQPPPAIAGGEDGSGSSVLQQGSVLMVYGMNNEKMNCQRIFNLFCLYGNVVRVKFLKSKEGVAMVQLGDNASCDRAIKNANGIFMFGHKMLMGYSKQAFVQDVPDPVDLPDGTVSFMDFMGNRNNRFTTPEAAAKNRIQPASKVLYFFNAPPGIKEADLKKVFVDCNVKPPTKLKIFPSKTERSSTGLLEWDNKGECVEALVAANHTPVPNPSGNNPYILKFCFSDAPIKG